MQQAAQQAAAQTAANGTPGARARVETRLVLNQRKNMILAQAAPDQMEVIEKAIEQVDVPADRERTLLQNINRMKVYRLESVDPQTLTDLLQQLERYWRRGNQLEFDLPELPSDPSTNSRKKQHGIENLPTPVKSAVAAPVAAGRSARPLVRVWPERTGTERKSPGSSLDELLAAHKTAKADPLASSLTVLTGLSDELSATAQNSTSDESEPTEAPAAKSSDQDAAKDQSVPTISRELIEKLRRQLGVDEEDPEVLQQNVRISDREPGRSSDGSAVVRISVAADGKLIVSSTDADALVEIEQLISRIASPRRSFKVFHLKYATASWITLNLKDFFKAEEQTKSSLEYDPYFGLMPSQKKVRGNHSLSKRRQPQFISDNFTSTILVRDADAKQLQTIEDLIAIYDIPEPSDSRSMRVTTIFRIKHARASLVAAAVKDVFRDLLSSNDKALEKDDKNQQRQSSGGLVTFLPGAPKTEGAVDEEPIRFKGLLSIEIDESSNTLIVSSAGTLMDTIGEMIEALDEAADSSSVVQVIKVDRTVDLLLIQERLKELMKTPQLPPGPQPGQPQPGQPVQPGVPPGVPPGADFSSAPPDAN